MKKIKDIIPYIKDIESLEELINVISNIIKQNQNGDIILQSIKGNVYERISQLIVFMKCSSFGKVDYYQGNINKHNIKKISSLKLFLEGSIQAGNDSGFSDLHFEIEDQFYISTAKYFLSDNKNVADYDLSKLDSITANIPALKDSKYLVFVSDKDKFINTFNNANSSSTDIYNNRLDIDKNVYGLKELQVWYDDLRTLLISNNFDLEYIDKNYIDTDRKVFEPFYHQKLAITWLLNQIYWGNLSNKPKKLLLDVLQGQGKTFIIFGLIIENLKKGKNCNYLLTSHRPSLFHQWINPFYEFLGLEKINVINYLEDRKKYSDEEWKEIIDKGNNFIAVSLQAIRNHENEKYDDLKNINFDIEIRDESQEGFETNLSYHNLENIKSNIKIYLSGTSQKNEVFQIQSGYFDSIFRWTVFDLIESKTGFHKGNKIDEKSLKFYNDIPLPSYFMYDWSKEFIKKLEKKGFPKDEYPTPSKVFEVKNNNFVYESEIKWWFESEVGNPLKRTGWLFDKNYIKGTTVITLDSKEQQYIFKNCLSDVLNEFNKNFEIHIINSDNYFAKELESIRNLSYGIHGRILLIVDQLRVGSNIEGTSTKELKDKYDAHTIIKLDSKKSFPINYQTDGRLLRRYDGKFGKKNNVRVIDPWPYRGYSCYNELIKTKSKDKNVQEKNIPIMLNSLPIYHNGINISDNTEKYYELLSRYTSDSYYNEDIKICDSQVRKIFNLTEALSNIELLYQIPLSGLNKIKSKKDDGLGDKDKMGKSKESKKSNNNSGDKDEDKEKEILKHIITFYNSLFYLPFLNNFKDINIKNILNNLHKNTIYNKDNSKIFYEKEILGCNISIILDLFDKNVLDEKNINIYINDLFNAYKKLRDQNLTIVDKLKIIYDLIGSYRNISDVEKKLMGEVFTPFDLIEEMLSTLPLEFWTNPKLKILDPANGVGNFPIIAIIKLMNGLKEWEPDEEKRFEHIITNIIHVCDIQPKNMFIYLQIFDPNGKYYKKMKFFRGSFLPEKNSDNFKNKIKEWNISGFDLIMGNPPYNDEKGLAGGGKNLYSKFIEESFKILNKNGYLSIVTNAGILKSTDNKRNLILEKLLNGDLYFLNINECKKYFPNVGGAMIFCYFTFRNNEKYFQTQVISQISLGTKVYNDVVELNKLSWIPRIATKLSFSIIEKCSNIQYNFIRKDSVENLSLDKNLIGFKRLNHLVKPYGVKATNDIKKGTWILTSSENKEKDLNFFNSKEFSFLNLIHRYDPIIYHKTISTFGKNKLKFEPEEIKLIEDTIK